MIRNLMADNNVAIATYTADVAMVRGMGVQKLNGEAILPTAATGEGIFFVTKEQIPTGTNTLRGEISDYDDIFEKIAVGTPVVLLKYRVGEVFATDQVTGTIADNTYAIVGTDGKIKAAVSTNVAYLISRGTYDDAGHALTAFEVVDAHTVA